MDNTPSTRDPLKHITITFSKQVAELWHKLSLLEHEMFIAPGGQPLDPPLLFEVTGLDSTKSYLFSAVFEPVSNNKLEYSFESGSWENSKCRAALTLTASSQSPKGFQTGATWMKEDIDFQHLKIGTDVSSDEYGVRLRPFHRYALLMNIYMLCPGVRPPIVTKTVKITDGEFIPVTHFYNPSMRLMKRPCPDEENVPEMMNRKRIHQDVSNLVILKKRSLSVSVHSPLEPGQYQQSSSTFPYFTAVRSIQNPAFKRPKTIKLGDLKTFTKPDEEVQTNSVIEEQNALLSSSGCELLLSNQINQIKISFSSRFDAFFSELRRNGYEILVAPGGLSLYPCLQCQVFGLDATKFYAFEMVFEASKTKMQFSPESMEWEVTNEREEVPRSRSFPHPDGIKRGLEWMANGINFEYLKTASKENPTDPNAVSLLPNHSYMPAIVVILCDATKYKKKLATVRLLKAEFVPVLEYHTSKMAEMKVTSRKTDKRQVKCQQFGKLTQVSEEWSQTTPIESQVISADQNQENTA